MIERLINTNVSYNCPNDLDEKLISEFFEIKVFKPQKGKMKELMNLAYDNAKEQMELQEETLKEYNINSEYSYICKKLDIKPITLSKVLQSLKIKGLIDNGEITNLGKELLNYLSFRNETILKFMHISNLNDKELYQELQNWKELKQKMKY